MKNFDHIVNWKLLAGSHEFPRPDGGTCINEAAIVAAGFEYKKISCADDCPPCFSRVIAGYAIMLNDWMPDDMRQELLMPFVTRMAGTRDSPHMEERRVEYMIIQIAKRIMPLVVEKLLSQESTLAERWRSVVDVDDIYGLCREGWAMDDQFYMLMYGNIYNAIRALKAHDCENATISIGSVLINCGIGFCPVFVIACGMLDGAIKLAKHTDLEMEVVVPRLENARCEKQVVGA